MYTYNGTITAVYDGDTLTCDMDLGFNMWAKKAKLRLYGLNTPEIRGGTALTKQAGYAARDFVRDLESLGHECDGMVGLIGVHKSEGFLGSFPLRRAN